jgi:hypothetical protein
MEEITIVSMRYPKGVVTMSGYREPTEILHIKPKNVISLSIKPDSDKHFTSISLKNDSFEFIENIGFLLVSPKVHELLEWEYLMGI